MKYVIVTLKVPVEAGEDHPSEWDWQTLIDASEEVPVVSTEDVT